ncbi:hypothetical protein BB561_004502 [Smittium simulii]|uniref:Endonuclease/exonuclease/phosphatase domain-containing protein n=1 Tax=Smittium simulii TaxID=133385 RepID=A0A2T9YFU5_9FUNG|nr:hypothetical protein BB561_004502 [Smittium simulii]
MPKVPGVNPSAAAESALNAQKFIMVSIMHSLDNYKPKALKRICYCGSDKKIGCSWTQFSGNIDTTIDHVALKIDNEYVSYQHDSIAKSTYFISRANQTVTLEEGTQIITIPSTNSINIRFVVEADFSAYENKGSGKFHTFGIKFLFKKTIDSFEIPTFLEFDKFVLALTYMGCKPVCCFCKQQDHWNSDCLGLKKFKKKIAKAHQKSQKKKPRGTKKSKEPEEHTVKSMQKKIDNFFGKSKKNEQKIILGEVHNEIAPQVKAIKDSTNPTKLQNRFTDFNSIKQPEESNLELSDQPIYADSSCPSIPNFKKKWDKSDENYTENNVSVAVIGMDLVNELADNHGFIDAEMHNSNFKVMTFNVQSIYNKVEDLELILNKTNPANQKKNLTKTGSGLLIAVQNRSSWSISELRNEYSWMSVKINSKTASVKENEIIVINIHTPHLATEKKIMKKQIEMYPQNIISKNENKKIILGGDFNMDTKSTIN